MPGLRERKRRMTRERLEEAALTLFERKGYDATRMEEVAAAAGVSTRTAFRYFATKADLVFANADAERDRMAAAVRAAASGGDRSFAALRRALQGFVRDLDEPPTARRLGVVRANEVPRRQALAVRADWTEALAAEVAALEGLAAPDGRSLLMAEAAVAALTVAMTGWAIDGGSGDLEAAVSAAFDEIERLGRGGEP